MDTSSRRLTVIVNLLAYYVGWLACVLGATSGRWQAGAAAGIALIVLHLAAVARPGTELRILLATTSIGYTVDSAQTAAGLLVFAAGQPAPWLAPVWIGVMWMLFSTTLRYGFHWLAGRYLRCSLFGLIGGPAAFWAGERLGAVAFNPVPGLSLALLAAVWAVLFPLLMAIAGVLGNHTAGRYRCPAGDSAPL